MICLISAKTTKIKGSRPVLFCKQGTIKNFTKFTGNELPVLPFVSNIEIERNKYANVNKINDYSNSFKKIKRFFELRLTKILVKQDTDTI